MEVAAVFLAVLSITVALYASRIIRFIRAWIMLRNVPSPPASGLLSGHAAELTTMKRHRVEQEHVLRLKSPGIIRYRSYWTHRVWLGDPKLLQDIFQAEREGLVEKPEFPPFHRGQELNVFSEKTNHPLWRIVRKSVAQAFQANNMRRYHTHVVNVVGRLIDGVKAEGPDSAIDISDIAQRESFDVIGMVGFGKDFQASRNIRNDVGKNFRLLGSFMVEAVKRSSNPLRQYSRSLEASQGRLDFERINSIMNGLIEDNQAPGWLKENPHSIAGHILNLKDQKGKPLSRARLIQEYFIFFLAGSETTGHTIAWTLYFLAQHPQAMAKLEAELDAAGLLVTAERQQPRAVTFADISKLRYLDCIIKEAMRLQPVAAAPLQRVAVQDFKLSNGVVIPAGVTIDLAQYTVMQEGAWGWKDGASFIPERWQEPDMEYHHIGTAGSTNGSVQEHSTVAADDLEIDAAQGGANKAGVPQFLALHAQARRYNPFGGGIRNCLGQQLARMNVPTAVAMFVANFHLQLTPEDASKSLEQLEALRGTLQPDAGIHMHCTVRGKREE